MTEQNSSLIDDVSLRAKPHGYTPMFASSTQKQSSIKPRRLVDQDGFARVGIGNVDGFVVKPVSYTRPNVTRQTARQPVPSTPRQTRSIVLRRPTTNATTVTSIPQRIPVSLPKPAEKSHKLPKIMTAAALFIFLAGLWISFLTLRTNHTIKSQVHALAEQSASETASQAIDSDQVPDETAPRRDITSYHVAADLPRFISIPKLGIKSRILRLGVSSNSDDIQTPASIYDTGWYDGSSKPDQPGAVLIDGHENGPTKPGVFYDLKKLTPGDTLEIEQGDGKLLTYQVVKSQTYPRDQVDMTAALTPAVAGKKGLNLITSTSKPINGTTVLHDHRLVVFTTQIN